MEDVVVEDAEGAVPSPHVGVDGVLRHRDQGAAEPVVDGLRREVGELRVRDLTVIL